MRRTDNEPVKPSNQVYFNQPLVWVTKTLTGGDTNTRIGIAEHIGGIIRELDAPDEFCTQEQLKDRLVTENLITDKRPVWPDVIIGPSLHIPFMQEIKNMSGGKSITVALRTPVSDLPIEATKEEIFKTDIIVSYPHHNNDDIPNLLVCESLPNRVTLEHLNTAKLEWAGCFSEYFKQGPVIGMFVGGDVGTKRRVFSRKVAAHLGTMINKVAENLNASILISMSARTSNESKEIICSKITVPHYVYDPKVSSGNNPYFGILGSVDYLVVTADSASMCCEAVSSSKPVYIYYDQSIVENSHSQIVHKLIKRGVARLFNDLNNFERFSYTPINSAKEVAIKVHEMLSTPVVDS